MLWQKESQAHDALYVDLLAPGVDHWESELSYLLAAINQKPHTQKSDAIALQKRIEGNEKFRAHHTLDALELYGDSLRFAHPKSEHISLAYANRAACFLSLKLYENCLKDIELAREADYPVHLMPKLQHREEICLRALQEDTPYPQFVRKLTIEPNEQFPCLANVVEVRKSEDGECTAVAKTDIDVGQVVAIEDSFQKYPIARYGSTCNICLKEYDNLMPCKRCADAMFCPNCQEDSLHEYVCSLICCGVHDFRGFVCIAQCIFQILEAFQSVDDLMAFVEQCRKNPTEWPANLLDERSKYQLFYGNMNYVPRQIEAKVKSVLYPVYQTLLRIPRINKMFQSTKHQRFLVHLIAHRVCWRCSQTTWAHNFLTTDKYLKHSCNPNLFCSIRDGKCIWFSNRPIKQGVQLNKSHIAGVPFEIDSIEERQNILSDAGFEVCTCSRCSGKMASPAQCQQMDANPTYESVMNNFALVRINVKKVNVPLVMHGCLTFLREYGRMDWCQEISNIIKIFQHIYIICLTEEFEHPLIRARLLKFREEYCS